MLLSTINDQSGHARELARRLKGRPALLNVIPYNTVAALPFRTPSSTALKEFRLILERAGINVKVRQRKGNKISAACGQLRRSTPDLVPLQALPTP